MAKPCTHTVVKITSMNMIKPSSPTPNHQRNLELSFLDQLLPSTLYSSGIFFYSSPSTNDTSTTVSQSLRASLSKALVLFYPLTGRLNTDASIDCNDEGAHFLEAQVHCHLSDLLKAPDHKLLNNLIMPVFEPKPTDFQLGSVVLIVQMSLFDCGGIALGVSLAHKIADGGGYLHFLRTWAAIHRGRADEQLVLPDFTGASVLPPKEFPIPKGLGLIPSREKLTTKRFVFDVTKVAKLKKKLGGGTNVELVSAIILRSAIAASNKSKAESAGLISTTMFSQTVSFRNKVAPAVAPNMMGNYIWSVQILVKQNETNLAKLVSYMRKGVREFNKKTAHRFRGEDGYKVVAESLREREELFTSTKGCINLYRCTSYCKFPLYEIDFGWGKPAWATSQSNQKNVFVLMDTKDGLGIEAWVTLDEDEMVMFEREEELLLFAYANPSETLYLHSHSRL